MDLAEKTDNFDGNHSPLMFNSDEEFDDDDDVKDDNSNIEESSNVIIEKSRDEKLVAKIKLLMTGVPPPPSFTTPSLNLTDILKLWNENQHLINNYDERLGDEKYSTSCSFEEAKTTNWPQVLEIETFGVHFNKSKASEELENLCSKYKDRYVCNETSSWVNSLYAQSPKKSASAKKRARYRGWGHSPGRRLSHLARRRIAFSSANLQNVSEKNALLKNKKMILVELKKPHSLQKVKTSSSSKKKKPLVTISTMNKLNNPKRALFQSPDDKPKKPVQVESQAVPKKSPNLRLQHSKRALWPCEEKSEFNTNGKRKRKTYTPSPRKKCNRNLFSSIPFVQQKHQQQSTNNSALSHPHKKKLLWAISQALREEGIRMNHTNFQACLSILNGPCMALWIWRTSKEPSRGSTSENMLAMIKDFSVKKLIEKVQTNSSSPNLLKLRLELMKEVEAIKLKYTTNSSVAVNNVKPGNSLVKVDKENMTSVYTNVKSCSPIKLKLKEDCNSKTPLKENNIKRDTPSKSVFNEKNDEYKTEVLNCFDKEVNTESRAKSQSPMKSEEASTSRVSFSNFLSWNADPISRAQESNFDLSEITKISANSTGVNIVQNQTISIRDEESSTVEFVLNDDETRSSSIYSFDLNSFIDDSPSYFDLPEFPNISCTNINGIK
uniref:Uncharacterized protein n=1 Tax=Clastoptera arizonana TaxID=38151 RepID=A0A1B6E5X4_9HEMI